MFCFWLSCFWRKRIAPKTVYFCENGNEQDGVLVQAAPSEQALDLLSEEYQNYADKMEVLSEFFKEHHWILKLNRKRGTTVFLINKILKGALFILSAKLKKSNERTEEGRTKADSKGATEFKRAVMRFAGKGKWRGGGTYNGPHVRTRTNKPPTGVSRLNELLAKWREETEVM